MNYQEFHIGLDLGIQQLNSNLFGKLQKEAKDYLINRTIEKLLLDIGEDARQTVMNMESYSDIRKFYNALSSHIYNREVQIVDNGNYVVSDLRVDTETELSEVKLVHGRRYKFTNLGTSTTNMSKISGPIRPTNLNQIFVAKCIPITATFNGTNYVYTISDTERYIIDIPGAIDYTTYGADNSKSGTEFTVSCPDGAGTSVLTSSTIFSLIPISGIYGGCKLKAIDSNDILSFISSRALVDYGFNINKGELVKGNYYRVVTGGTTTLLSFGASANIVTAGEIFYCTKTGTPTYGNAVLVENRKVLNRLIKPQDVDNFLNHDYGTTVDSPISVIANEQLYVYHNGRFKINKVFIEFVRMPIYIDCINGINTDINPSLHPTILEQTIQNIIAKNNSPNYQQIVNENKNQ